MVKYNRRYTEIEESWKNQLDFIKTSIKNFDDGNINEAIRLAQALRVMFHETNNSKSIYNLLNYKLYFKSLSGFYSPTNLLSSWMLLSIQMDREGIRYVPLYDQPEGILYYDFEDWWNHVIFDDKKNIFSRKDIVLYVANKDGGAHLDLELPEKYANLVKYNSLGWTNYNGDPIENNPVYMALRVIAQEVIDSYSLYNLTSLKKSMISLRDELEVRFFPESKTRFIWCSPDINTSQEAIEVVELFEFEKRNLYFIDFDDIRIEYVGNL